MAMALIGIGRSHPSTTFVSRPRRTATFKALLEYERTRSTWVRGNYYEPWPVKYSKSIRAQLKLMEND